MSVQKTTDTRAIMRGSLAAKTFDAKLNSENPTINILGREFLPSEILKKMRPSDYHRLFNNWVNDNKIKLTWG